MISWTIGEMITGTAADGRELRSAVFNENEVRASAGLALVVGAVAFVYAYFDAQYVPLRVVSTLFFVEFLIRVTAGLRYSPMGVVARWMTRRFPADWVSAKPKRFAWTLALVLSGSMMVITNVGITGLLPRTLCLVCLVLLWMESVLGLCLGCEIHKRLVLLGWTSKDPAFEICAHGVCEIPGSIPAAGAPTAGR